MFTRLKKAWEHPKVQKEWSEFRIYLKSLQATLNKNLFDASPDFWSYHVGGIAVLLSIEFVFNTMLTSKSVWDFYAIAGIPWSIGFFFSGLVLRSHYKNADWENQPHSAVLFKTVASSVLFGFFIVFAMLFLSFLLHLDDLRYYTGSRHTNYSSIGATFQQFFRNWLGTSFYLLCWMMLYIGITSRRKTRQIEVDNLRLQNSLKEAELVSLSNQLNPHFLFNALNNIRFMIHEDARNAEKMLMSLSSVLRYSLDSSKNEKVLLKDELEISRRYIDLIQIQFEERLNFELDISDTFLECRVPPMVLQMLLENAVKHGIDNIREGGTILVQAQRDANSMIIHVYNDLPHDYAKKHKEPGIGLLNIGQRLDLLYQGRGSISTEVVDKRFCVTVVIPQEH